MTQKAPERIWAEFGYDMRRGAFWDEPSDQSIEYLHIDHTLALVAAAYEDAAQHHDYHADGYKRSPEDKAAHQEHAKRIRARTDDDAQAALERVKQEARNEALREAFNVLRTYAPHQVDGPEHDVGYASGYATAQNRILALIEEDQSDE